MVDGMVNVTILGGNVLRISVQFLRQLLCVEREYIVLILNFM